MRALNQVPGIGSATTNSPDGVVVDEVGGITGTALTEILYGDMVQAVHKLRRLAGITPNNLLDGETNGYQMLQGFIQNLLPAWQPSTSKLDFSTVKFVTYGQGLYYHKTATNTANDPAVDTTNWHPVLTWDGYKINLTGNSNVYISIQDLHDAITDVYRTNNTTIQLASGVSIPSGTQFTLVRQNACAVSVEFRVQSASRSAFSIGIIPSGYRPSHPVTGICYRGGIAIQTEVGPDGVVSVYDMTDGEYQGSAHYIQNNV